jgi:hypothetical protein
MLLPPASGRSATRHGTVRNSGRWCGGSNRNYRPITPLIQPVIGQMMRNSGFASQLNDSDDVEFITLDWLNCRIRIRRG